MNEEEFFCPYCGSPNTINLENQSSCQLVTDCETCCKPIVVRARKIGEEIELEVRAENE